MKKESAAEERPQTTGSVKMKQITTKSGKGETNIAGAFAALSENNVLADCGVDDSNLHLPPHPHVIEKQDFNALKKARVGESRCVKSRAC